MFKIFCCATFLYEKHPKSKARFRARPAIMLGFNDRRVYTVERLPDRKVLNSVHVIFDEEAFPYLLKGRF